MDESFRLSPGSALLCARIFLLVVKQRMTSSSGAGEALSLQPQGNSPPTISSEVDPGLERPPGASQCPVSTHHLQDPLPLCTRRERLPCLQTLGKVPFVLSDTACIWWPPGFSCVLWGFRYSSEAAITTPTPIPLQHN